MLQTPPEKQQQLDRLLLGPRTNATTSAVDPEAGVVPPAWWDGDEEATQTSLAAAGIDGSGL